MSIRGLKRDWNLSRPELRDLLRAVLAAERAPTGDLAVAFVGDRAMRRINREYRDRDETTDVLSFSYIGEPYSGGVLGEIYVSPAVARRQADELGGSFTDEIHRLCIHGVLHILGWTHDTAPDRRRMIRRQEHLLARFRTESAC